MAELGSGHRRKHRQTMQLAPSQEPFDLTNKSVIKASLLLRNWATTGTASPSRNWRRRVK